MKRVLALTTTLWSCAPTLAPMNTLHPTTSGNANSAGISMGPLYAMPAESDEAPDGSLISFPFGEGFVRFAAGAGEVEARISPFMGSVAYRLNLAPVEQGTGVAIIPGLGVSYFRESEDNEKLSQTVIAPSLIVLFMLSNGQFYVAPRFSILNVSAKSESDFGDDEDSTAITVLGGFVGFVQHHDPFKLTFELSFQRLTSDEPGAEGAVYIFLPTVGIHL